MIDLAILRTLCYHELFNYPLALEEIWKTLDTKTSVLTVQKQLEGLMQQGKVQQKKGFYFLKGEIRNVGLRKNRQKISQEKFKIAEKTAHWLRLIPTVKMVAVTGALAVDNAQKEDDLDFLIVTTKNRLWLTRMAVVLLIELVGQRRRPTNHQVANKICLNVFLDENHLAIPRQKRNLFTAHEISHLKIIWQKSDIYQRLLKINPWVKKFLPNWKI